METNKEPKMKVTKKTEKVKAVKAEKQPKQEKPKRAKVKNVVRADDYVPAKTFIEDLCNAGETTKATAVEMVVLKYGVTEKAAKGAVGNCRHYQKKEGRKQGVWKLESK